MAYATSIRRALEKLRVKILGPDAEIGLLTLNPLNGNDVAATVASHFFLDRETDLIKGEEYWKLEIYPTPNVAGILPQVIAVNYRGLKYRKTVLELPTDSADIYCLRLEPTGEKI